MTIHALGFFLRDVVFPRLCVGCEREGYWMCPTCSSTSREQPTHCATCGSSCPPNKYCLICLVDTGLFCLIFSAQRDDQFAQSCVKALKHDLVKELALLMGDALIDSWHRAPVSLEGGGIVTAIPLHWRQERARGFNQAEEVAISFSKKVGLPYKKLLTRIRSTRRHAGLTEEERIRNMTGAFIASSSIPNSTIILIDDTYTTGATMREAARLLKENGASRVIGLVFAHGS